MAESTSQSLENLLRNEPVDSGAAAQLTDRALELRLIPVIDGSAVDASPVTDTEVDDKKGNDAPPTNPEMRQWIEGVSRGFLDAAPEAASVQAMIDRSGGRRNIGVFDPTAPIADVPVGTYGSYVTELTVPGGNTIPAFAVTAVTVAATHRRRGIARQMMEGELRTAARIGIPVATLTVSESSIYQRYGFAPAANAATWEIDRRRAGYQGPAMTGRVDYITLAQFRELAPQLHDTARLASPGEVVPTSGHWDSFASTRPDAKDANSVRAIQYRTGAGDIEGVAVYKITENMDDYTKCPLSIRMLITTTDQAYAALWRYFFEHDLIGTITAELRSADEPLRWMIADQRAAKVTVIDHQYVRILNVAKALESRTYGSAGRLVIDVTDPLGIDTGRYALEVSADGSASVTPATEDASVTLSTVELSALFIGGTAAATLIAAGRMTANDVTLVDAMFRTPTDPRLSFWY